MTGWAGVAGIQDDAGFFSESAKADASFNIRELQKTLKKDVCVETFKEIPADVKQGVNPQNKAALNRMFDQWAVKRARLQSVNGVYLMLVKEPSHLQVVVGNDTQKQAFTLADRDMLVGMMLAKLRTKDYDAALREGMSFVASTMKIHATSRPRDAAAPAPVTSYRNDPQPKSSGGWLLPLLIIGLVLWVVLAIVRSLFRGGAAGGGTAMSPAAGGGGGFFRNMLGGMFGAAAGMWMYDQFFGSHGSSAYGASQDDRHSDNVGGGGGDSGFSGQDTDYTSSGGSFGDDSGGGGFDGGDSGGGDSGGGGGDF